MEEEYKTSSESAVYGTDTVLALLGGSSKLWRDICCVLECQIARARKQVVIKLGPLSE